MTDPSKADTAITVRLKNALKLVAVRVINYIIVAENETVSIAERGHVNF